MRAAHRRRRGRAAHADDRADPHHHAAGRGRRGRTTSGVPARRGRAARRAHQREIDRLEVTTRDKAAVAAELALLNHRLEERVAERTSELTRAEIFSRTVLDTAGDAIVTLDRGGHLRSWNAAAEQIFGYARDEVVGRHVSMLRPPGPARNIPFDPASVGKRREAEGWRKDGSTVASESTCARRRPKRARCTWPSSAI